MDRVVVAETETARLMKVLSGLGWQEGDTLAAPGVLPSCSETTPEGLKWLQHTKVSNKKLCVYSPALTECTARCILVQYLFVHNDGYGALRHL